MSWLGEVTAERPGTIHSVNGASNEVLRGIAVIQEQDASAALLRGGVRLLRHQRFASEDLEPVLALLSPGLERLSKLALGAVFNEANGRWPTDKEWRAWGHRVAQLCATVEATIEDRRGSAGAPGRVAELQSRSAEFSPVFSPLLETIDAWAQPSGRYANFDTLSRSGARSERPDPRGLWHDLTASIGNEDPNHLALLGGNVEDWEAAVAELHGLLADSVTAWIDLTVTAWNVGTLGALAKSTPFGPATWPRPR